MEVGCTYLPIERIKTSMLVLKIEFSWESLGFGCKKVKKVKFVIVLSELALTESNATGLINTFNGFFNMFNFQSSIKINQEIFVNTCIGYLNSMS